MICDFGFVSISLFVILGRALRAPTGWVWVQQQKTCLLNGLGSGNRFRPVGRVLV